jgi:hypothetical protein
MAQKGELDVLSETTLLLTNNNAHTQSAIEEEPNENNNHNHQKSGKKKNRLKTLRRRVKDPFNKRKIKELKWREKFLERVSRS